MAQMFFDVELFNQDIGAWNTSSVTDMSTMFFSAKNFNQDIGGWDVSSVTTMESIFQSADAFNQDVGAWDVSSVTDMSDLFYGADQFNQDLGGWDVSSVTNMTSMLGSTSLSTPNYDALLLGWSAQTVQPNVSFFADSKYSQAAANARSILRGAPNNWTLNDNGPE